MTVDGLIRESYGIGKPSRSRWRNKPPRKCSGKQLRIFILLLVVVLFFLLVSDRSLSPLPGKIGFSFAVGNYVQDRPRLVAGNFSRRQEVKAESDKDLCRGRYVYVHDLPSRFNQDVLKSCRLLNRPTDKSNMCDNLLNLGFGPRIENSDGVLSDRSWYSTNQFLLEVIFHSRMKNYECLTNDSSLASAIFVPFYAGLDLRRYLWRLKTSVRDSSGIDLVRWLAGKPEWRRMGGRDHFLVAGRISRDFRRQSDKNSDWGSKFRLLPESQNMSMLSIESSFSKNDFAIPYPTYFHPSSESEIFRWQDRMRRNRREFLFSFAGAPRSRRKGSIREEVISQCKASTKTCKFLDCDAATQGCEDPVELMKLFQKSVFCLQPPGDSFTRRSIFDSILSGCIPVFFHPGSAYEQYKWHLPRNHTEYSVYIPPKQLKSGKHSIEQTLLGIRRDRVEALREEVVRLIPRITYRDPMSKLETIEDAFDLAIKGILQTIEMASREQSQAQNPSF